MAADNAIIIGLIAANFAPDNRKKIIALGVAGAFIFRIFFAKKIDPRVINFQNRFSFSTNVSNMKPKG